MTGTKRFLASVAIVAGWASIDASVADASIMVPKERWSEMRLEVREAAKSSKRSFDAHAFKWDVSVHGKEFTCIYLATGPGMAGINHWILSLPKGRPHDGAKPSSRGSSNSGLLAQSDHAADRARSGRGPSDAGLGANFPVSSEFAKNSSGTDGGGGGSGAGGGGGSTGSPHLFDGTPLNGDGHGGSDEFAGSGGLSGSDGAIGGPTVDPVVSFPAAGGAASSNEQALVSAAPEPTSLFVWMLLVGLAAARRSRR